MRLCVAGPEVLQGFGTLGFLDVRDPVTSEDIEPALFGIELFENWVEAALKGIRLEKLAGRRSFPAREKVGPTCPKTRRN